MKTYNLWACPTCGREMSMNGLASVSHLRGHVRRGELVEITLNHDWSGERLPRGAKKFVAPDEVARFEEMGWVVRVEAAVAR